MQIEKASDSDTNSALKKDNKNDSKKEQVAQKHTYKSDNGENVDVTFFEKNDQRFVKIKRTDKDELILPQTNARADGADYEKENYKWTSKNDDATFADGKETMKLVVISPLQYKFTNEKEDITVTYFGENDKRFVSLKKDITPK